jgi:dienelactone hydrolase
VLVGCGHSPRRSEQPSAPRLTFGYERSQPLDYTDRGVVTRQGLITVHDIAYVSVGERVEAYLAEAAGREVRQGVVLVHGSGGDRSEFLPAAVALAQRGIVAMTITEPSAAHPPAPASGKALLAQSRAVTVRDVVAIRRAADVLTSLSIVDPRRLGYLGWSAGARTGAFVAASDRRFKALALLSAGADKLAAFVNAAPAAFRPLVKSQLGSVDPLRYISWARPGTLLLEDGTRDAVVPHHALLNMIRAAPRGTILHWYTAGHPLDAAAYRDAFAWLVRKLRVGG